MLDGVAFFLLRRFDRRATCVSFLLLTSLLAVGCESHRTEELEQVLRHTEAVVSLLETHRDNPSEALARVDAYQTEHAIEIAGLMASARELRRELSSQEKRRLLELFERRARELEKRLETLGGP